METRVASDVRRDFRALSRLTVLRVDIR